MLLHYYDSNPNPAYRQISKYLRLLGEEVIVGSRAENDDMVFMDDECTIVSTVDRWQGDAGSRLGSMSKFRALVFAIKVAISIQSLKPDVVQLNRAHLDWYWILPLIVRRAKFVIDCRQVAVSAPPNGFFRRIRYELRKRSHIFLIKHVFCSASYLHVRGAQKELGIAWEKHAIVVPLGVDDNFFAHDSRVLPYSEPFRFLYLGGINRIRKLEILIKAADLLRDQVGERFTLTFVGPDKTHGYYQGVVDEMRLTSVVSFINAVPYDEVPQLMCSYHVALAYVPDEPQDWEYQPTLKVLEYLAIGKPIIGSAKAPNRDVIFEKNGLLVENSPSAWQQSMGLIMSNPEVYSTYAQNANECRGGDSWMDVSRQYLNAYRKMVSR